MPELENVWDMVGGIIKTTVGLVGTAGGLVLLYKGLSWIFSLI